MSIMLWVYLCIQFERDAELFVSLLSQPSLPILGMLGLVLTRLQRQKPILSSIIQQVHLLMDVVTN